MGLINRQVRPPPQNKKDEFTYCNIASQLFRGKGGQWFRKWVFDIVPLLRVNDDAKVFRQHHVVLKINNRLRRPGANHLERQLNYKTQYANIGRAVQRRSSREPHLQSVTRNCYTNTNKRITRLSYRPLQLPTSFHLTARYRYALESSDDIMFSVL